MWSVLFNEKFDAEFEALPDDVQDELYAQVRRIEQCGPTAGRPRVDTLNGSAYPNMKELRFEAAGGVWRTAFAFDPKRLAVILVAADKAGVSQKAFYRRLISKADARYANHLKKLKSIKEAAGKESK